MIGWLQPSDLVSCGQVADRLPLALLRIGNYPNLYFFKQIRTNKIRFELI